MTMTSYERQAEAEYKSPPEAKTVTYCADCGNEYHAGESLYHWDGKWLCAECVKDDLIKMSAEAVMEELELERRVVA